jgi:hypothetical protein
MGSKSPVKLLFPQACMNVDGSFVGSVNLERAGIGFHSSMSAWAATGDQ